jgi:hypothetical protein
VKISKLAILGLISFSVCVIFISDFLNPISDLEFSYRNNQLGFEVYTLATFNPYFSLGLQMLISSFIYATGTGVNLMSIPAISGGPPSSNYRIYIVFLPTSTCCYKIFRQK